MCELKHTIKRTNLTGDKLEILSCACVWKNGGKGSVLHRSLYTIVCIHLEAATYWFFCIIHKIVLFFAILINICVISIFIS